MSNRSRFSVPPKSVKANACVKTFAKPPPVGDAAAFALSDAYRADVRARSYIGKKGYTVPKSVLHPGDLKLLYQELTMVPVKHGAGASYGGGGGGGGDDDAFPVYRENANKIYLPRFYGIERYGYPEGPAPDPPCPTPINCPFEKPLRDYQEQVVSTYVTHVQGHGPRPGPRPDKTCPETVDQPPLHASGGILTLGCGMGKCLAKDTDILMYDGTIKAVQDVVVGDQLMGDDSTPRNVLTLARGREMMYKVHTKKGDGYTVNRSHILSLKYGTYKNKQTPKNTVVDISVMDYYALPDSYHGRAGKLYGYRVPVTFEETPLEIDPYLVGYWLGDGNSRTTGISTQEAVVIKYLVDLFKTTHTSLYLKYVGSQYDYRINSIGRDNELMRFLNKHHLILNKHIPHHYKCNSRRNQLALLAGIIDSDGYYHNNCYEIAQKNERLLDDIVFLARSLGFAAFKSKRNKTCTNARDASGNICPKVGTYYITVIYGTGVEDIPVLCPRKRAHPRELIRDALKYRIRLERLKIDDYYGFEIDGNRRFVLGDFTVTHNTVISIKIISALSLKTLIVVHKEFLMNQWIERLQEFLPSARIGKIQGPTFDSAGKDVVIGMLQTLYDRDFPDKAFDDIGLLVFDEVHRSASSQFSRALLRIQPPYMLGVTATLERKDGLTKLIHMFMGPVVYAQTDRALPNDMTVVVRAMTFTTQDSDFNHVVTDYRGNPQFSTMITKLCNYNRRTQFIVNVLEDLIAETPDAQVLVLGHNRSLLTEVFAAVAHRGFAEPGMYVGGMKQADLDASSKKQVVVSTFSMSSEALDIPTLQILVMMTPKTDIVQVVGRIFRAKHAQKIIVDIVDRHDVFQNQWRKRRAYYKKCGYMIQTVDSTHYARDFADPAVWTTVHDPARPGRGGRGGGKKTAAKDSDSDNEEGSDNSPRNCMISFVDDGVEP